MALTFKLKAYIVGGYVRDKLLGLPNHDRDWVVVGSSPNEMQQLGFISVGKSFPVFLHPETKEEYALARKELKTGEGHQGFEFDIHHTITLKDDLERRDLTINSMAIDPDQPHVIIDPFHGQTDLEARILRHTSHAFAEDPLRILRIARFQARYQHLKFHISEETQTLIRKMIQSDELSHLSCERIWLETLKALATPTPLTYFRTLNRLGVDPKLFPIIPKALASLGVPEYLHPTEKLAYLAQHIASEIYQPWIQQLSPPKKIQKLCLFISRYAQDLQNISNLSPEKTYHIIQAYRLRHDAMPFLSTVEKILANDQITAFFMMCIQALETLDYPNIPNAQIRQQKINCLRYTILKSC